MLYPQAVAREEIAPVRNKLSESYHRWFEITPADTPDLVEKAYRLRYLVYCCENEYENAEEHPHQMETDAFDCQSIHSLIVDRASGAATGTVRLIIPDEKTPEPGLPIQQICSRPLPALAPISSAAEVSRFAISKKLRNMGSKECPKDLRCSAVLGLMRATVQMSLQRGITDWFAVMEPSLLRLLCRFGIYFVPIGPLVNYHGLRQPCHANVAALLENVCKTNYDLWEFVIESNSWPANSGKAAGISD